MTEDKRIKWCKDHCLDHTGTSYIGNLDFNDQIFIEIDTYFFNWLILEFNAGELPDFIKFKVKSTSIKRVNIDLEKCSHLKLWQGLPTEKIEDVWFGSELENIESMPICDFIYHSFIKNQGARQRANKKLRIKQWQKFQSEVLRKLQKQNPEIDISNYIDGIEWLAIHYKSFYKSFSRKSLFFTDDEIFLNIWAEFESVINPPPIKIKINSNLSSELYIDDDFNHSDGEKLMNNISGNKEIYVSNQEDWISENDFLKLVEEKVMNDLTYSVHVRNNRKNK